MADKEPGAIQMLFGLATLGWLVFAWDAYLKMALPGSVLALFAGVSFVYAARVSAPVKEMPWLFGWNDDPVTHMFARLPVYASFFVGPITKHIAQAVAPGVFEQRKAYLAVMFSSVIVGIGMSLYMNIYKRD